VITAYKQRIYAHKDSLEHDTGPQHPECIQRFSTSLALLELKDSLDIQQASLATREQLLLAHSEAYIKEVEDLASTINRGNRVFLDADTILSAGSLTAALRAVGACCAGIDDLMQGEIKQVFCLSRPPGHHATHSKSMGFCIFNQIACAALYALYHYGIQRMVIVDFDVHHGNGTQDIISRHHGIHFISTHQSPLYPGTGSTDENLPGKITNIPLPPGTDDQHYIQLIDEQLIPLVSSSAPQLILVSAGFDAHADDPLASMQLTESTYFILGKKLGSLANTTARGRILATLEGGYNLEKLGGCIAAFLDGCAQAQA
jgi:acetoin utilization deacetylase AcuC-like enzyme